MYVCAKRQLQVSFCQVKLVLLILGPVLELNNSVLELYSFKMNLENALKSGATRVVAQSLPNVLEEMSVLPSTGQTRYDSAHLSTTWVVLAGDSQVQGQPKLNETFLQKGKEIRVREETVWEERDYQEWGRAVLMRKEGNRIQAGDAQAWV